MRWSEADSSNHWHSAARALRNDSRASSCCPASEPGKEVDGHDDPGRPADRRAARHGEGHRILVGRAGDPARRSSTAPAPRCRARRAPRAPRPAVLRRERICRRVAGLARTPRQQVPAQMVRRRPTAEQQQRRPATSRCAGFVATPCASSRVPALVGLCARQRHAKPLRTHVCITRRRRVLRGSVPLSPLSGRGPATFRPATTPGRASDRVRRAR